MGVVMCPVYGLAPPLSRSFLRHVGFIPIVFIGVMAYNVAISDDILIVLVRTSKSTLFLHFLNLVIQYCFGRSQKAFNAR